MTTFNGTVGNDSFTGTSAGDVFVYGDVVYAGGIVSAARGIDLITSGGGFDRLQFGNLGRDHLAAQRQDGDLTLFIQPSTTFDDGNPDTTLGGVRIANFFASDGTGVIDLVQFVDGYATFSYAGGVFRTQVFTASNLLLDNEVIGSAENDSLAGTAAQDFLAGELGNDTLLGLSADDALEGRDGNDSLVGGDGDDTLDGGAGADKAAYYASAGGVTVVLGAAGADGTAADGSGGVDVLRRIENAQGALDFADRLTGNEAANRLEGLGANDSLVGGAGNDTLDGGSGADSMTGGDGNDLYIVDSSLDVVAESGVLASTSDAVQSLVSWSLLQPGNGGIERLVLGGTAAIDGTGNALANALTGNMAANLLAGAAGNDTLSGGGGNDSLSGGDGNDTLVGGAGVDRLVGGAGNDRYGVDSVSDIVSELGTLASSADLVTSSVNWSLNNAGNALVEHLTLTGTAGVGTGNGLANQLTGNAANNALNGGSGDDTISGGGGSDTLIGGGGNDQLDGGAGQDVFRLAQPLSSLTNVDRLVGFASADDTIQLENGVFTALLATGTLQATALRAGAVAGDANDRIVYNAATGQLFYDSDGTGAAASILFATLVPGTALAAADFVIV